MKKKRKRFLKSRYIYDEPSTTILWCFVFPAKHEVIEEQQKRDQHEELEFYEMVYNYMYKLIQWKTTIANFVDLDSTAT